MQIGNESGTTRVLPSPRSFQIRSTFTVHKMPKLLVLFDSRSDDITRHAEAVAEGARSVRFAEVDLRRIDGASGAGASSGGHKAFEGAETLAAYDGIIVGAAAAESRGSSPIDLLSSAPSLVNKVGSAFAAASVSGGGRDVLWAALTPMGDRGMIIVAPPTTDESTDTLESARSIGKRVADVVGWVTHARSHHHHH